ncbi:hypothetical protein E2C01_100908 [Portunus trituberculatus]|uniref:Uncharacterized protein n=1 Tax=Portunus trituberculatus TaxID=210409 RepID=A0A5B7KES7_PORTR|nr:hypothetical protein [Portunus trituberculatus]
MKQVPNSISSAVRLAITRGSLFPAIDARRCFTNSRSLFPSTTLKLTENKKLTIARSLASVIRASKQVSAAFLNLRMSWADVSCVTVRQ